MTYFFLIGFITGFFYTFCAFSSILTAMQFSLRHGVMSGFIAGMGHTVAQIVWIIIAIGAVSLGGNILKTEISHYKFIAAGLLFLLGIKFFISSPNLPQKIPNNKFASYLSAFLTVFTVAISAPGRIIGYLAFFMLLNASLITSADFVAKQFLLGGTLLGIISWWFIFSVLVKKLKLTPSQRQLVLLQRLTAFILIGIAIGFCLYQI
jgi:threonine/homoserine/homoserine lactone efflux protein